MPEHPLCTAEELTARLTHRFLRFRPRTTSDSADKGRPLTVWTLPHPENPNLTVSLEITEYKGYADSCTLWFGQAQISACMLPDEVESAVEQIVSDQIAVLIRYRSEDDYDNHRKSGRERVFRLAGESPDQGMLEETLRHLRRKPSPLERLFSSDTGVFELIRYSGQETIRR